MSLEIGREAIMPDKTALNESSIQQPMKALFDEIMAGIVVQRDQGGEILRVKSTGSSMEVPAIDNITTALNMSALLQRWLSVYPPEQVFELLQEIVTAIKSLFVFSHDGFRSAKGISKADRISVADIYAFSIAAGYCLEVMPHVVTECDSSIGIGVMAPARQYCGKNLIRLVWQTAGYRVIDLGSSLAPDAWIRLIEENELSVVGISCMRGQCIANLEKLLSSLGKNHKNIGIVVGGISINAAIAFDLSGRFGISCHYGRDVTDAVAVLKKSLAGDPLDIPAVRHVEALELPMNLTAVMRKHGIKAYRIPIRSVVISDEAREGCALCDGDKKGLCPLMTGFEKPRSVEESRKFVEGFHFGVVVIADAIDASDRQTCKFLWDSVFRVETYLGSRYRMVYGFRFPTSCPFCPPAACSLPRGHCSIPSCYRPVPEVFNISMPKTMRDVFGDSSPGGMFALILVR